MPFVLGEGLTVEAWGAEFLFRWPSAAELGAIRAALADEEDATAEKLILGLLIGWSGVVGLDGNAVAFSTEALSQFSAHHRERLALCWFADVEATLERKKPSAAASGTDSALPESSEAETPMDEAESAA